MRSPYGRPARQFSSYVPGLVRGLGISGFIVGMYGLGTTIGIAQSGKIGGVIGSTMLPSLQQKSDVPAVTFADVDGVVFVPARAIAENLALHVEKRNSKTVAIGDKEIPLKKSLYDGRTLIPIRTIEDMGGRIDLESQPGKILASISGVQFSIEVGKKKISVDQAKQWLTGTQGELTVIETPVSTGAPGHRTPNGSFVTGPYKSRYHYSRLYNGAPMPYSIQVNGNVFFHGFTSVPRYPASHGCVRVPLGKRNPAKYLFNWAETGIPTTIEGKYEYKSSKRKRSSKKRR